MMWLVLVSQTYTYGLNHEALTGAQRVGSAFIDGENALTFQLFNLNMGYSNVLYNTLGTSGKPLYLTNYFGLGYALSVFEASVILNYNADFLHSTTDPGDDYYLGYGFGDIKLNLKVGKAFMDRKFAAGLRGYLTLPTGEKKYFTAANDTLTLPLISSTAYADKGGLYRPLASYGITYGFGGLLSYQSYPIRVDFEGLYSVGDTVQGDELLNLGLAALFHVGAIKPYAEVVYFRPMDNMYKDSSALLVGFGFKFGYPNMHFTLGAEKPIIHHYGPYGLAYSNTFKPTWTFWLNANYTYEAGVPRVQHGDVIVIVKDEETEHPIEGASVILQEKGDSLATDATGKVEFSRVVVGSYNLKVTAKDYVPESRLINVTPGKMEVVILLKKVKKGNLTIVVKDASSGAPVYAEVSLFKDNEKVKEGYTNRETGTIIFKNLEPGVYSYNIKAENYVSQSNVVEVKAGPVIEEVNLQPVRKEVKKVVKITGKVTDMEGKPLEGVKVIANEKTAYTDALGFYEIDSLPTGVIKLGAVADGFVPYSEIIEAKESGVITKNITLRPEKKKEAQTGKVIITVLDKETKEPVKASIEVVGTDVSGTTNDKGEFTIELGPGEYAVKIKPLKTGYLTMIKNITIEKGKTSTVIAEVAKKGFKIKIRKIYFDTGKATIKPESYPILEEVCSVLKEFPNAVIEVEGHTDTRGSAEYNLRLSQARADAVRSWLINHGCITPDRIKAIGYGESRPEVFPERTPEDYQRNRRVVIRFIGEAK